MNRETPLFDREGNRKYLNWPERKAFLAAANQLRDPVRKAFCLTLFYTGCRISEALRLRPNQVDLTSQFLVFETLKRRKSGVFRPVFVPPRVIRLIASILPSDPKEQIWGFSRTTGYRIIKDVMREAGIEGTKASPKGLRHSFAFANVSQGIPVNKVQSFLGHSELETTSIYLEISGEDDRDLLKRIWIGEEEDDDSETN